MAKEREEKAQMRFVISEDKEAEIKQDNARPPISPDRTAVKIDQTKTDGLDIEIMDRSSEAVGRIEGADEPKKILADKLEKSETKPNDGI